MKNIIALKLLGILFGLSLGMTSASAETGPNISTDTNPMLPTTPALIRSNLTYTGFHHGPHIHLADLSVADPLNVCPLETLPPELDKVISLLVGKMRDSVSKIKNSRSAKCMELQDRLDSAGSRVAFPTQLGVFPGLSGSSNISQDRINAFVRLSGPLNDIITNASDMMHHECIESVDERIVIQRLIGQVITVGGIVYGSWQGMLIAMMGQVIGNVPVFKSKINEVLELFQKYDEKNEHGAFLCLMRQMQKSTCLFYSTPQDEIVGGVDLTFKTGVSHTTQESVKKYQTENPDLFDDIVLLRKVVTTSETLKSQIKLLGKPDQDSITTFQTLREWCSDKGEMRIKSTKVHPYPVSDSLLGIGQSCLDIQRYQWPTQSKLNEYLTNLYWKLLIVEDYYNKIKKDEKTAIGKVVSTWESMQYFENLKRLSVLYANPSEGNQSRINYLTLTNALNNTMGKRAFNAIFKKNRDLFRENVSDRYTQKLRFHVPQLPHIHDVRVKKRAFKAILDLCKTMDPTLTCLYPEKPFHKGILKKWARACAGPRSKLCNLPMIEEEKKEFLSLPADQVYYDSLCGRDRSLAP